MTIFCLLLSIVLFKVIEFISIDKKRKKFYLDDSDIPKVI